MAVSFNWEHMHHYTSVKPDDPGVRTLRTKLTAA